MAELGVWYLPMQDAEDILSDEQRTPTSRAVQDDFNGSPLTLDVRGVQAHLTAALLSRPSVDELAERGIVRSPSACIAEQLGRKLARRPSREEVPQNILDSKVHQVAKQLSRRSLAAALDASLQRRPSREQMMEEGKIPGLVKHSYHPPPLKKRPSNEEMMEEGKLPGLSSLAPEVSPVGKRSIPSPPPRSLAAQFGYTSPTHIPLPSTNSEYVFGGYF